MTRPFALLLAGATLHAAPLRGQTVSGRVLAPPDTAGVEGITVTLRDKNDHVVARTIAGSGGRFVLTTADTGHYTIRLMRLGYRPTDVAGVLVGPGSRSLGSLEVTGARIVLAPVHVRDHRVCERGGPETERALEAWQAAQHALAASIATRAQPLDVEIARFVTRTLVPSERVVADSTTVRRGPLTRPFVSPSPSELESAGFASRDSGGLVFYAPDEEVLLSPAFVARHCLWLEPGEPGDVVLAFAPVRDLTRPDIAGTLTLEANSSVLTHLRYTYVNTELGFDEGAASGRIDFVALPRGRWMVGAWTIRTPVLRRVGGAEARSVAGLTVPRRAPRYERFAVQDEGGEVTAVRLDSTILWSRSVPSLVGRVVDSTGAVVIGTVGLPALKRHVATDSIGRFRVPSVHPGRHTLTLYTPLLDSLGLPPIVYEVDSRRDPIATLTVPAARSLFLEACDDSTSRRPDFQGMLLRGVTRDSLGSRVGGVTVIAEWVQPGTEPGTLVSQERRITKSAIGGDYAICGVRRNQLIRLRTEVTGVPTGHDQVRTPLAGWVVIHDLRAG